MAYDTCLSYNGSSFVATNIDLAAPPAYFFQGIPGADAGNPSGGTVYFPMVFTNSLLDVPNGTEFTTLFQAYQIAGVKASIRLANGPSYDAATGIGSINPDIYYAFDPNDNVATTSTSQIQQHANCRWHSFNEGKALDIFYRPRPAQQLYSSGTFGTSYGYPTSTNLVWIDTTSPSNATPHYAMKFMVRQWPLGAGANIMMRIQLTYFFRFRYTR